MRKSPSHECAEDVDWSHALHRESVLQPLSTRGSLSNEVVKEAAQTIGISRAHFYRLLAAYKQMHRRVLHVAGASLVRCANAQDLS